MKIISFISTFFIAMNLYAQGVITGLVKDSYTGQPLNDKQLQIKETAQSTKTGVNGNFTFTVTEGIYTINILGDSYYESFATQVYVKNNKESFIEINLIPKSYKIDDIFIYGVSKSYEKIIESPSSAIVLYQDKINIASRTNQIASALSGLPGVDVLRNGSSDFIVNTRGFNSGLNRRVLVLQDGRDVSMPLLGAIEWNSFSYPLDDYSKIEFIKGPSASLYGANAFNGVLSLTSYSPREVLGTRVSILGGDYKTYRLDIRNAGIITNRISYKITIGRSSSLNFAHRRDSTKYLEYPGLIVEARPMYDDERNTFSNYGTFRIDYDFKQNNKLRFEGGYSNNGNEAFVFGLGRTLVKNTERPYLLLSFSNANFYFHTHYMKRHAIDTMWLLLPRVGNKLGSPLLDNSDDFMIETQYNFFPSQNQLTHLILGLSQQFQNIRTYGTSIPNDVNANYTGIYGQLTQKFGSKLKLVGTLRFDRTNIHQPQLSPRLAFVFTPKENHQFRFSISRSFQRPNYSELYRLTPDAPAFAINNPGPPVPALIGIDQKIADSIRVLAGWYTSPNIKLNLDGTRAFAIGNDNLKVEKNIGLELGYNGNLKEKLFFTIDTYYNILNDFITNFLPAVNPNFKPWEANLPDSLAIWNNLATSIVYSQLSPRDKARLSYYNGLPTFIVSNTNIGTVKQYGIDVSLSYFITEHLTLSANYSYYDFNIEKNPQDPDILPNTSPHKVNLSVSYNIPQKFDAGISFQFSDKFDWLAGAYKGSVPAYKIINLSIGYRIWKHLQVGTFVYNLFNEKHYEMFGGTYLPRNFYFKATLDF
jgi:outer membrane receptor for ferrienterochelin and colicins